MEPMQNAPVNFFMGGGRYISDNFNMQIIDTSNPNAFDDLVLTSVKPDMMSEYIQSEKTPDISPDEASGTGFLDAVINFFKSPPQETNT